MLIRMWAAIAAIAAPIISAVLALLQSRVGGGPNRHLKDHAALLVTLPEKSDSRAAIEKLVVVEAESLLHRQRLRDSRQLNVVNLVLSLILAVVSGIAIYVLVLWAQAWWGTALVWIPLVILALGGLFLLLLTGAAFTTLYTPAKPKASR
jgi:hypothetical protein